MIWVFYAFLTAIFLALSNVVNKKVLFKEHALEFSTVFSLFNAALTAPLLLNADFSSLNWGLVGMIYAVSLLAGVARLLLTKSTRHLPISEASPFTVFSPAVSSLLAFLLIGESLETRQVLGIALLLTGIYFLESDKPLREQLNVLRGKYVKLIFAALLLYGFSSVLDRKLLGSAEIGGLGVPVVTYIPLVHFFIAFNYLALSSLLYDGLRDVKRGLRKAGWWIFLSSVLIITSRTSMAKSLTFPAAKLGLVLSIKSTQALFTTLLGGSLFKEEGLFRKTVACAVMLAGVFVMLN